MAQVDPRVVVRKTLSSIIPWMFFVVIWTYLGMAAQSASSSAFCWVCLSTSYMRHVPLQRLPRTDTSRILQTGATWHSRRCRLKSTWGSATPTMVRGTQCKAWIVQTACQ